MLVLLLACDPCTPVAELDQLIGDDGNIALRAFRDFDAWTGRSTCLDEVALSRAGTRTPEEIFHDGCVALDEETGIAATRPDLFTGLGLNTRRFPTPPARVSEDFARACGHSTDLTPWVNSLASECGGTPPAEDRFLVDLFGPDALPVHTAEDVYLGSITTEGYSNQLGFIDGALVLLASAQDIEDPPFYPWRHRLRVYDLAGLSLQWEVELPSTASYSSIDVFPGHDAALLYDDALLAEPPGRVWQVTREGLTDAAPLPTLPRIRAAAQQGVSWLVEHQSDEVQVYDPTTGLGAVLASESRVGSHPEGTLVRTDRTIRRLGSQESIELPWWVQWSRFSTGRVHTQVNLGTQRVHLSRTVETASRWQVEKIECEDEVSRAFPIGGATADIWFDSEGHGERGRRIHIWDRRR